MSSIQSTFYRRAVICFAAVFSFFLQGIAGDYYVYLNDGTVRVFPDSCVLKKFKSGKDRILYIYPLVGEPFKYSLDDIALDTDTPIRDLPTITSFKFNNKYNYQVVSDAYGVITDDGITVEVSGIGKRLTASFKASDETAKVYIGDEEVESTVSRLRYDSDKVLSTGYLGDSILTRFKNNTYGFKPYRKEYALHVIFLTDLATSVPRIDINTVGGVNISSKDKYIDAEIIIDGKGAFPSMTDSVQVRGRGNTSWSSNPNAKNPYRLKFEEKVKPLGMTNGKNWVLLANKMPGSMLTNAYGMKLASLIGTPYPNNIIPVDLYVNGVYKGSYNLTEKVGLYNNSVELDNEKTAALLELDDYYDEEEGQKFTSSPYSIPVNIKEPDFGVDTTMLTFNIIKYRFNRFAKAVYLGEGITDNVDVEYLARYLLTSDLLYNRELFHPKSVFCYNVDLTDLNSKFVFGPVWDLDWGFGYTEIWTSYFNRNATKDFFASSSGLEQSKFFCTLRNEPKVARRIFELCRDFVKNDIDELCEYFEDYYLYAKPSLESSTTAYQDPTDYAVQSVQAVSWIRQRANYLLNKLKREMMMLGDVDDDGVITIKDVTTLIDYLLGVEQELSNDLNADINQDGVINMQDTTVLIDIILGQ
jgi:hypothetical protein